MISPVDEFFLVHDFAEEVTYTAPDGTKKQINVIFDDKFSETKIGNDVYENLAPTVRCKSSDITGIRTTSKFKIRGITYNVVTPQTDILGVTTVVLSQDAT